MYNFTQEKDLKNIYQKKIIPFWKQRQEGYLCGEQNKNIYWVSWTNPTNKKSILLVNGRTESVIKYQETFYDLFMLGYNIYSFDHRGQGFSDRVYPASPLLGHVEQFDDYVLDLASVVQHFNLSNQTQNYMVAHSMGGAIATRYLQAYPQSESIFQGVILSAPMFGIAIPWYFKPIAKKLTKIVAKLSSKPSYALGQKTYTPEKFSHNKLTNSQIRYSYLEALYQEHPQIQLGGASNQWVFEAIQAGELCIQNALRLNLPFLILQAEDDAIIDNKAHTQFITHLNEGNTLGEILVFPKSRHELFFESDKIRQSALEKAIDFMEDKLKQK